MPHKTLTPKVSVAGQMSADEIRALAAEGYSTVICNRPDGEEPGQPAGAEIQTAAEAAGLAYRAVPISGRPGPEQARAQAEAAPVVDEACMAWLTRQGHRPVRTVPGICRDGEEFVNCPPCP